MADAASWSYTKTTAISASTAITVAVMEWLLKCYAAGHFIQPDNGVVYGMASFLAPIGHATRDAAVAIINRIAGRKDAEADQ